MIRRLQDRREENTTLDEMLASVMLDEMLAMPLAPQVSPFAGPLLAGPLLWGASSNDSIYNSSVG